MATQISSRDTVALRTAPGHRLRADAAASWDRLSDATAARYGWRLAPTDSHRPTAVQERIFTQRYQTTYIQYAPGKVDRRYWPESGKYWYRKPGTAAAAVPGTSNHGGGTAVDAGPGVNSYSDPKWKQFAAIAGEHGWDNREGKSVNEPWHWTYNPVNDRHRGTAAITPEDDMPLTQQDLINILEARFEITQDGQTRTVSLREALAAVYFYGDRNEATPARVWAYPLKHAVTGDPLPAGDFLRYLPAEHEATRAVIVAGVVDRVVERVDAIDATNPEQIRQAITQGVTQGVTEALSSVETTITISKEK